jgi:hypothetical protein
MKSNFKRNKYLLLGKLARGNVLQKYGGTGVSNQKSNNNFCVNYKAVNPETNMQY